MRKIYAHVLLIAAAIFFASPVQAGNVDDCEALKDATKGLYGLCIAYHNAEDPNTRERILANYNKKAEAGDPAMPGTGAACPCFGESEFVEADNHAPYGCGMSTSGAGIEYTTYEFGLVQFNVGQFTPDTCFYAHFLDDSSSAFENVVVAGLSSDEIDACRTLIDVAIDMDFGGISCEATP